jgi:gluconokinase
MSGGVPALVVMGVAGCGKSALGRSLAESLGWHFIEADAHHPPANVDKMRRGVPLGDEDRAGWLAMLATELAAAAARGQTTVLACSALKARYRDQFRAAAPGLRFAFLGLPKEVAARRVADRPGHYMPASLVDSQFADLEPPTGEPGVLTLDAVQPLDVLVQQTLEWLSRPLPEEA